MNIPALNRFPLNSSAPLDRGVNTSPEEASRFCCRSSASLTRLRRSKDAGDISAMAFCCFELASVAALVSAIVDTGNMAVLTRLHQPPDISARDSSLGSDLGLGCDESSLTCIIDDFKRLDEASCHAGFRQRCSDIIISSKKDFFQTTLMPI